MKIAQTTLPHPATITTELERLAGIAPTLVLVFAAPQFLVDPALADALALHFPDAVRIGCSTAGEISGRGVTENSAVVTAIAMEHAWLTVGSTDLDAMTDSAAAGRRLAEAISAPALKAVLVFGQGVAINGGALVEGMKDVLRPGIPIMGGLAGDNGRFSRTYTLGPAGVSDRAIVAVGIGGEGLRIGNGSFGGWEAFGPARKITRCDQNLLYELDGEPALDVYRRYLGEYAEKLPASGLLFPFAMLGDDLSAIGLIRTILGIDEAQGSLTLAGEITEGSYLKLMHASTDALVDGAEQAALSAVAGLRTTQQSLSILVSCVGRKLVMGDRTDEEVEAVAKVLGSGTTLAGFYSYGEISPFAPEGTCRLHNQTMTITTIGE